MEGKVLLFVLLLFINASSFGQSRKPDKNATSFEIKTYSAPGMASVNSYYIVTNEGIIVIDSQRVLSQAAELLRLIKATGKPIIAVILTHNHPDHIGGLTQIVKEYPDVSIYATTTTTDGIASDKGGYQKLSKDILKNDFPGNIPRPNKLIRSGETLTIAGVQFEPRDMGAGEAESILVLYLPAQKVLFASDLIAYQMTPFLLEERTALWIKQLDDAQRLYSSARIIYPGHGASGEAKKLIEEQKKYLVYFRRLVGEALKDNTLTPEEKTFVVNDMQKRYQGYLPVAEIPDLLERNVDALVKEMQSGNIKPPAR